MDLESLDGVGAARGGEPAGRRTAVDGLLIPDDEADQWGSRSSRRCRSNCSSPYDRLAAVGSAPNRYSPAGSCSADDAAANMARSCRRTRLRTTAGPSARPSANATRGGVEVSRGSRTNVHHRSPARARCPSACRRANARRSRMRQIKPTDGDGPWRDATSARRGRRGCSCGRESRASWHDGGCWVGRCASRSPPRAGPELPEQHRSSTNNVRSGAPQIAGKRQNSRPDYGRAASTGNRHPVRHGESCLVACAPHPRSVVHTMWTMMWMPRHGGRGGAGE